MIKYDQTSQSSVSVIFWYFEKTITIKIGGFLKYAICNGKNGRDY